MFYMNNRLLHKVLTLLFSVPWWGAVATASADFSMDPVSESQYWSTYSLTAENSGSDAINLDGETITFVASSAASDVNWSSPDTSYPNFKLSVEEKGGAFHHSILLTYPSGSWVDSELATGEGFVLTISTSGMFDDIGAIASSASITGGDNGSLGGETTTSNVDLSLDEPQEGAVVIVGQPTQIKASVSGSSADKLEFWAGGSRIESQEVTDDKTEYTAYWVPTVVESTMVKVIAFDVSGASIEESSTTVEVMEDTSGSYVPEVTMVSPEDGATHKQGDTVRLEASVTDADDDVKSVAFLVNDKSVCSINTAPYGCDWVADQTGSVKVVARATDEKNNIAEASSSISIAATGGSCGAVPPYESGKTYALGDQVTNIGNIYECKQPGWCGNDAWTPGTGHPSYPDAWKDAWDEKGACDPNDLPSVEIVSPESGTRISPELGFVVDLNASDDTKVTRVDISLSGSVVQQVSNPSDEQVTVRVDGQPEGAYTLVAIAYDDKNAFSESNRVQLAITDKTVVAALDSPEDNSTYREGNTVPVIVSATALKSDIKDVKVYEDSKLVGEVDTPNADGKYEYDIHGLQKGDHQVKAIAEDLNSNTAETATANISIIENSVSSNNSTLLANDNRTISYLTSWGLSDIGQLYNSKADAYLLSFGKWDASGNITTSDGIASMPSYDPSWMNPAYLAWTQLKYDKPDKAMLVAFGGQTYESIWSDISTPSQRETVANALVELVQTPFPVYKKGLTEAEMEGECLSQGWDGSCNFDNYQLSGYVQLDGLDFDFEKAARITQKENEDLEALIDLLREKLGDSKILTLTTYHVGADPLECATPGSAYESQCSYIEPARSSHHGEIIELLKATKNKFDLFNVMTYDAGPRFKYNIAMENYAQHVGDKTKIILGNTINSQWGPEGRYVETRENNLARSQWQFDEGYGGLFMWALGSNTQSLSMTEQVEYLNAMVDVSR